MAATMVGGRVGLGAAAASHVVLGGIVHMVGTPACDIGEPRRMGCALPASPYNGVARRDHVAHLHWQEALVKPPSPVMVGLRARVTAGYGSVQQVFFGPEGPEGAVPALEWHTFDNCDNRQRIWNLSKLVRRAIQEHQEGQRFSFSTCLKINRWWLNEQFGIFATCTDGVENIVLVQRRGPLLPPDIW